MEWLVRGVCEYSGALQYDVVDSKQQDALLQPDQDTALERG